MTSESPDGHRIVLAFLGPRYIVGIAGLSVPPTYTFNAIAADDLVAYGWTRAQMASFLQQPALRHHLDQIIYHYTEVLATRLHTLSEGPLVERLAAVLLELAVMHGVPVGGRSAAVEITPPVSYEDLGGLSGTTVETVNRYMTLWGEQGAVVPRTSGERRKVRLYPDRLRDLVWRGGPPQTRCPHPCPS
jgi:CRP-like cAMP-binding protein